MNLLKKYIKIDQKIFKYPLNVIFYKLLQNIYKKIEVKYSKMTNKQIKEQYFLSKILNKPAPTISQIDDINYGDILNLPNSTRKSYYQKNNEWVKGNINKIKKKYEIYRLPTIKEINYLNHPFFFSL